MLTPGPSRDRGAGLVLLAAVALPLLLVLAGAREVYLAGAAVALLAVLVACPREWLPSVALVAFVVLPERAYPAFGLLKAVTASGLVLTVWAVRCARAPDPRSGGRDRALARSAWAAPAVLLLLWSGLLLLTHRDVSSLGWLVSITLSGLSPLLARRVGREGAVLARTWVAAGTVASLYAQLELRWQGNRLYDPLFDRAGVGSVQHWSVYRADASFGHPLYAGTFFAVAVVLGLGLWLAHEQHARLYLALAAVNGLGVVSTVSRGALYAVAAGVVVLLAGAFVARRPGWGRRAGVLAVLAAAAVVVLDPARLQERADSTEGARSASARHLLLDVALRAARATDWLGAGPGASQQAADQITGGYLMEDSWLQLLVSLGLPGVLAAAALLVVLVRQALRAGNVVGVAAAATLGVALLGFNGLEGQRLLHVMIGCCLVVLLSPPTGPAAAPAAARVRDRVGMLVR